MSKLTKRIKLFFKELKPLPHLVKPKLKGQINMCHVAAFTYKNAGDVLLPVVLRDLFNQYLPVKRWSGVPVYKTVDSSISRRINRRDVLVIGGGGLFLKDTNANDISGWQWPCSIDQINAINKPMIMFAVGYNRFRGQDDFEPYFTDNLNAFVERASFVGIRNNGSINKLRGYLRTEELKDKLTFQPCMTTLISKIYPHYCDYQKKEDFIAVNCAFDRGNFRSLSEDKCRDIASVVYELSKITKIKYYSHKITDCRILKYFDELGFDYELVELNNIEQIVREYSKPRLVVGMRGHAQMIPFGCHTPILSIVSHDKMQWFLDDIHHPEWGVDILDAEFKSVLLSKAIDSYNNYEQRQVDIIHEQSLLLSITESNMDKIRKVIE